MINIGVYKSFKNSAIYRHDFLENIKMLYKTADKYYDEKLFKDLI